MKKLKTIICCSSILLMLFLSACNAADKFEDYVLAGNYADAISVYRDKISGNIEKEQTAQDFMLTYVGNVLTDYAEGSIDAKSATNAFNCISRINENLSVLGADFYYLYDNLNTLHASKESFEEAVRNVDKKDYKSALELFAEVNELDTQNYSTAQEQMAFAYDSYKAELTATVNKLIQEKEFEQAIKELEDCTSIFGGDEEYEILSENVISAWEENLIYTASEIFGADKDYQSAIRFLQLSGLQNDTINAEITKYQDYIPIYLTDLEYTKKTRYMDIGSRNDEIMTDLQGNTYDGAHLIYPAGGSLASEVASTEDEAYVNYYLNAGYSKLTGVLYVPYKSLSCPKEWTVPTIVKIYGDKVLLFEAPAFTTDVIEPLSIEVDVTGVRELRIVMLGVWHEDTTWGGLYSRYPKVCAANFCVSK